MYKLLLYGFAVVITVLVLLFITLFMIDINTTKLDETIPLQEQEQPLDANVSAKSSAWINKTDIKRDDSYYYPVTEINIHIDLTASVDSKYNSRLRKYKLVTQKLDDYHYFCLKQVLDQSQVQKSIERYENEIGVILYASGKQKLDYIVNELKKYEITSKVSELRNEKWKNLK